MSELYYIEMESARNKSLHGYFNARPLIDKNDAGLRLFEAGYERGFQNQWTKIAELELRLTVAIEALEQIGKHPVGQQGMTARKALEVIKESEKP